MKKSEQVYREILYQCLEKKNRTLTQKELSIKINTSLSNVNHSLQPLIQMGAIHINQRNFKIINPKKILLYWASVRNIGKDIIYATRVDNSVQNIEKNMPNNIIFTACSAYKLKFKDLPADYSEVYVYADLEDIKKRFKENKNTPNLFILKKDENIDKYKTITLANLFVDLWNLKEWYAKDFLKALEERLNGILE